MTYKELADLIFPNVKEINYYEEKYPERNLEEGAIVTRFAPSPTGFVHIGGLYQALVARTVAKKTNGVFFLRVEDTDQKREVENGVTGIVNSLKDFDMAPDEGMISDTEEIGNYGPYKQSLRKEIYQSYAKYLLEQGKAYPCFATAEELDEMRAKQEAAKVRTGYYGVWAKYRNLSLDEMAEKINAGVPYIIRFKSPGREDRKIKHKVKILKYKLVKNFLRIFNKQKYENYIKDKGSSDYKGLTGVMKKTFVNIVNYDLKKCLKKIKCDVVVIGSIKDNVVLYDETLKIQKILKSSKLYPFYNSGHFSYIDEENKLVNIINREVRGDR